MKTHIKLIKKGGRDITGILSKPFKAAVSRPGVPSVHPSIHPSIHGLHVWRGNHLVLLYFHYTLFPSRSFNLFNYSITPIVGIETPLAAPENNADKNALNLSAKANTIRIIDGCKMQKEKKKKKKRCEGAHLVQWDTKWCGRWGGTKKTTTNKQKKLHIWMCWAFSRNVYILLKMTANI